MAVDMAQLTDDLAAESGDLFRLLSRLEVDDWDRPTPAAPWTIRDQVTHLAFFDDISTLAATDVARFEREATELTALGEDFAAVVAQRRQDRAGPVAAAWLQRSRSEYLQVFRGLSPSQTLPWFGPPMSAASSVTARLMETWAHGQDIADTVQVGRTPTSRLRHVAHLGVRTLAWSFTVQGRPAPDRAVRVELAGPDGETWRWGPEDAEDRVLGSAEEFCLVATQRRHRGQTGLQATGPVATAWLDIAQAYAGPPGPGRPPGGR
ncbi:MAG: TIGR03084 family metal-binding protein [Mycobacteriales bacterium]